MEVGGVEVEGEDFRAAIEVNVQVAVRHEERSSAPIREVEYRPRFITVIIRKAQEFNQT